MLSSPPVYPIESVLSSTFGFFLGSTFVGGNVPFKLFYTLMKYITILIDKLIHKMPTRKLPVETFFGFSVAYQPYSLPLLPITDTASSLTLRKGHLLSYNPYMLPIYEVTTIFFKCTFTHLLFPFLLLTNLICICERL